MNIRVKSTRENLSIDNKEIQEEYSFLKKKFPSLLEGLI